MLIAAVLCLCAAVVTAALGLWSLKRPVLTPAAEPTGQVLRAVAPTQLAAAVMLAAGGSVALAVPQAALPMVVLSVVGAVGTVAVGCYQSAKLVTQREAAASCAGSCASCTLSCH